MLEFQEANGISGSLYEIGLFCGKYFSLLLRSAALTRDEVVGLDTFDYVGLDDFQCDLARRLSPDHRVAEAFSNARILKGSSGDISPRQLLAHLGGEARFISIDGSHEYEDVLWDLSVADDLLAAGGLVAADDFLHPISIGVTAALFHFFETSVTLVPFAHVSNKLFLCRPAWADRYRDALEVAILGDAADAKSIDYRSHRESGNRHNIEAVFRGYRVLTIRL